MKIVAKVLVVVTLVGMFTAFTGCGGNGSSAVTTTTTSH